MNIPDDISEQRGQSDDNSSHAHYDESKGMSSTGLSLQGDDEELDQDVKDLADKNTEGCSLKELLQGRTVFLVRHGNTGKASKDEERSLTPLGERQCAQFVSQYGDSMERVMYCFSSPVKRCTKTAKFLGYQPTEVEYLYFSSYFTSQMKQMDDELGYAPLGKYLSWGEGQGEIVYGPVRAKLGAELAKALGNELTKAKAVGEWEGDIVLVTHATTISLLAQAVLMASSSAVSDEEKEKIDAFNVGECEGFQISCDAGQVTLLKNDLAGDIADGSKNSDFVE